MARTMPSTTIYRRAQVVVVEVPFSDLSGTKRRPALVVSSERFHRAFSDVIVCPISSQPRYYRNPGPGDCPLRKWRMARLRHPSTVRISKIVAVDKGILGRVLGRIAKEDLPRVEAMLEEALELSSGAAARRLP